MAISPKCIHPIAADYLSDTRLGKYPVCDLDCHIQIVQFTFSAQARHFFSLELSRWQIYPFQAPKFIRGLVTLQGLILGGEDLARSSEIISLNTFIFPTNVKFVVGIGLLCRRILLGTTALALVLTDRRCCRPHL